MKFNVILEIKSENVPVWSYSQGITDYTKRDENECIEYLKYILTATGIKILKIEKENKKLLKNEEEG